MGRFAVADRSSRRALSARHQSLQDVVTGGLKSEVPPADRTALKHALGQLDPAIDAAEGRPVVRPLPRVIAKCSPQFAGGSEIANGRRQRCGIRGWNNESILPRRD